ncbi:MAG TPA: nucleotidyltransferase domain-containing protein, partial [Methylomicrobium sp.]|nr:nucleotidyltransferase domain-containing protein [Methylomicrobium sp.]
MIDTISFGATDSLQLFKQLLKLKDTELREKFDPHQSVLPLLHAKSDFIDAILGRCWRRFLDDDAPRISLIAVGGYGRRELFPYSDIDIMVLLDVEGAAPYQDALVQFFTFLWDIGLKPGQSVRTVKECVREACDDQTVMTSLMEMRLISGNE